MNWACDRFSLQKRFTETDKYDKCYLYNFTTTHMSVFGDLEICSLKIANWSSADQLWLEKMFCLFEVTHIFDL